MEANEEEQNAPEHIHVSKLWFESMRFPGAAAEAPQAYGARKIPAIHVIERSANASATVVCEALGRSSVVA